MRIRLLPMVAGLLICQTMAAQLIYFKEKIVSPYTIKDDKAERRKQKLIDQANSLNYLDLDSNEAQIESALWAVSQFLVRTPQSDSGVSRLLKNFEALKPSMQRGLMEVVYGLYPNQYANEVKSILLRTDQSKLFAQCAAYLLRKDPKQAGWLRQQLTGKFPNYADNDLLVALNQQTAFLSPPVAMAAFYLKGVSPPHVTLNQIFAGMLPFMGIQILAIVLLYVFPEIGLWLPQVLYK